MVIGRILSGAVLIGFIAACGGPSASPSGRVADGAQPAGPASQGRTFVTVAYGAEVNSLASKLSAGVWSGDYDLLVNAPLSVRSPEGVASPRLAAELPSREAGSWAVNPDGSMRTTWKIRPTARWHDGQPVTSRDVVFGLAVALDPAMPIEDRRPEQFMERIEPLDDRTFVIHWKSVYPWANELGTGELEPLPQHVMGQVYESSNPDAFLNHSFWTSPSYVGTGPYRIVRWDPGSQLVFRAFDEYVLGRPKIDEVIFRIIPDPNAVVANLLAGEAHVAINIALGQMAGATVKEQWTRSGDGTVSAIPVRFRFVDVQRNPTHLAQPALQDLRVRRALLHGLDRVTLAEISTAGLADPTDVFLSPQDQLYERAVRAMPKYPYDVARALALLRDAGWTRQGDNLVDAGGRPFTLDIFSSEGSDNETEAAILAADFRKLGMQVSETIYPRSLQANREFRASFVGLNPTAVRIEVPQTLTSGLSDQCPDASRRYAGGNRGCWVNAEFDRLYEVATTSLDPGERGGALIDAHRIMNDDVGKMPLAYRADAIAYRKGLVGPGPRFAPIGDTWNVHEWRWE